MIVRAGGADEEPEHPLEAAADRPAVGGAERCEQAEGGDDETGAERAHVDERAAGNHQGADGDEGDAARRRRPTPIAAVKPSAIQPPTIPPLQPR